MSAEHPKHVDLQTLLPGSSKVKDAFQVPFRRHRLAIAALYIPGTGFKKSQKTAEVITDIYWAGLGHFMHMTEDPTLQKLGQLIANWANSGRIVLDPVTSLHEHWKNRPRQKIDDDIPAYTWGPLYEGDSTEGVMAHVAAPFVGYTHSHPVESLSTISQLAAMIYEVEQGVPTRNLVENQRSNAVQAHLLKLALQEDPTYRLMSFAQRRIKMHSLDISQLFPRL